MGVTSKTPLINLDQPITLDWLRPAIEVWAFTQTYGCSMYMRELEIFDFEEAKASRDFQLRSFKIFPLVLSRTRGTSRHLSPHSIVRRVGALAVLGPHMWPRSPGSWRVVILAPAGLFYTQIEGLSQPSPDLPWLE